MWTDAELAVMRGDQESLMRHRVIIDRESGTRWDEAEQATVPLWTDVYEGKARVALIHGEPIVTQSGEVTSPQQVMVTVPYGARPEPGDRVRVTDPDPGVPEFVWVSSVEVPGIPTACRMACRVLS